MDLILLKDVDKLGKAGDRIRARDGYGRNFLLPRGLALVATAANIKVAERQKKVEQAKQALKVQDAEKLGRRLSSLSITIAKKSGPDDKLYGALTAADIAQALENEGVLIDRKDIQIPDSVKKLGVYSVGVKLHGGAKGKVKVWVVKE